MNKFVEGLREVNSVEEKGMMMQGEMRRENREKMRVYSG